MADQKNTPWQDDVYRTMMDLANLADDYLCEPETRPWRNEVKGRLRQAIDHARTLVRTANADPPKTIN